MDPHTFLANVAAIASSMTLLAVLEAILPLFTPPAGRQRVGAVNVRLMLVNVAANWITLTGTAVLALCARLDANGPLARLGVPFAMQVAGAVVLLDFGYGYLAHRLMHHLPPLWRVHRVHHSDAFVDVTTTFRTHPLEGLWRHLFVLVPVAVLGLPPHAVVLHRALSIANGVLEHANVRVWRPVDRGLSWLWVTPDTHKLHHSRDRRETDTNYGNVFAIFDRLLGTYTASTRLGEVRYGLDDAPEADATRLLALLAAPFAARRNAARAAHDPVSAVAPRS